MKSKLKTLLLIGALGLISPLGTAEGKKSKKKVTDFKTEYKSCRKRACKDDFMLNFMDRYNSNCRFMFDELCEYEEIRPEAQAQSDLCLEQLCYDRTFLTLLSCYGKNCDDLIGYCCDDYKSRLDNVDDDSAE
ncbi:MAG: hypothetical protein ABIF40_05585 [archaeon]